MSEVERLIASGSLVTALLLPCELGGEEVPQNVVYVPPETLAAQRPIIERIEHSVSQGLVTELDVRPEYRGDSLVPFRIFYQATHLQDLGPVSVLQIW